MNEAKPYMAAGEAAVKLTEKEAARFWGHVTKLEKCWEWDSRFGEYGTFWLRGRSHLAHRLSYLIHSGGIASGLMVCHTCDNRRCVYPDHFFLGTSVENMLDMRLKGRAATGERNAMLLYKGMFTGSKNPRAIVNESNVPSIRERIRAGESRRSLATEFGVSKMAIDAIATRRNWKHVS